MLPVISESVFGKEELHANNKNLLKLFAWERCLWWVVHKVSLRYAKMLEKNFEILIQKISKFCGSEFLLIFQIPG